MRRVLYLDESGQGGRAHCTCLVIAGVLVEVAGSYLYGGIELVDLLKRRYGIRRELKWRVLKRMGVGEGAYRAIVERYPTTYASVHIGEEEVKKALLRLMRNASADLYVVDEGLIKLGRSARVVARASHKVPGLQLADVVAGRLAEELCRRGRKK